MKKFFSTIFCILLLSAITVTCAAAEPSFSDASEINNWEQVCMLYDLGLITGFEDGTFRPDNYITRAEAAKIVSIILDADSGTSGESAFTDMESHWASSYVYFCTEQGLFSGFGDGSFLPDRNITARELVKTLLAAIGCDTSDYVGENWAAAVDADAAELGIYSGFQGQKDQAVTRDDACLLIFNALNCYAVQTTDSGLRVYVTDDLLNPITVLENRFGVVKYEEYIEANEYVDLANPDSHLEEGFTRLYGHREFAFSSDLSMLGRWMGVYMIDNTIIGIPYYSTSESIFTFDSLKEMKAALSAGTFSLTTNTACYINYVLKSYSALDELGEMVEITAIDHDGDQEIDIILAVSYEEATVLEGRTLTLLLHNSSDENTDAPTSEEIQESDDLTASSEETVNGTIITGDEIVSTDHHYQAGEQIWVVYAGGRYLIKETAE